jgi:hypothetical protein
MVLRMLHKARLTIKKRLKLIIMANEAFRRVLGMVYWTKNSGLAVKIIGFIVYRTRNRVKNGG